MEKHLLVTVSEQMIALYGVRFVAGSISQETFFPWRCSEARQ